MYLNVCWIIPSSLSGPPCMVCDLPVPVYPNAKMVVLQPSMALSMWGMMGKNTSCCVAYSEKIFRNFMISYLVFLPFTQIRLLVAKYPGLFLSSSSFSLSKYGRIRTSILTRQSASFWALANFNTALSSAYSSSSCGFDSEIWGKF